MTEKKTPSPLAREVAAKIKRASRPKPKAPPTTPPPPELVSCPACASPVAKTDVDPSKVRASVDDPDVHRDITERRIRRAARRGHFADASAMGAVADRESRTAAEEDQREPRPGLDQCPVCNSQDVTVDEHVLSPTGRRVLQLSRSDGIDRARKVREEKSEVSQQMHRRNKRLQEQRAAEAAARSRNYGGIA